MPATFDPSAWARSSQGCAPTSATRCCLLRQRPDQVGVAAGYHQQLGVFELGTGAQEGCPQLPEEVKSRAGTTATAVSRVLAAGREPRPRAAWLRRPSNGIKLHRPAVRQSCSSSSATLSGAAAANAQLDGLGELQRSVGETAPDDGLRGLERIREGTRGIAGLRA